MVTIFLSLILAAAGYLIYLQFGLKRGSSALLTVSSLSEPLTVSLDDEVVGKTPVDSLKATEGDHSLNLTNGLTSYQTKVTLLSGTQVIVNWGLGPGALFNEGGILWFERTGQKQTASLVVISDPEAAEVRVDGVLLGVTPLFNGELSSGEHTVSVAKDGYKAHEVPVSMQKGFKLNLKAKLPLVVGPTSQLIKIDYPDSPRFALYDLSTASPALLADPVSWLKAIIYFRSLGEESTKEPVFDYFLDGTGRLYNGQGAKIATGSDVEKKLDKVNLGYLGQLNQGLTDEAKASLKAFAPQVLLNLVKVQILATPYGWLRVREQPSLSGKEVAKVNTGEQLEFLEESSGWYKIKLTDGTTGYILSSYAKKL